MLGWSVVGRGSRKEKPVSMVVHWQHDERDDDTTNASGADTCLLKRTAAAAMT